MSTLRLALRLLGRDWPAGELRVLIAALVRAVAGIPNRGEAWIDTRLAERLGATLGSKIAVGESTLDVGAIFLQDPEITGLSFALGPKLLLNRDDVPATHLLQPGNRATWRLLIADRSGRALEGYRDWLNEKLGAWQR